MTFSGNIYTATLLAVGMIVGLSVILYDYAKERKYRKQNPKAPKKKIIPKCPTCGREL